MSVTILHAPTAAALAAATSQQAQIDALAAPWGGGNVRARYYSGAGLLLRTQTLAPWVKNSAASPRRLVAGGGVADTAVAAGAQARVVFELLDGTPIFQVTAAPAATGAVLNYAAGAIKTLCRPTIALELLANAALPGVTPSGAPLAPTQLVADGIWTWFTMPEARQVGDHVYVGTVSSDGRCRAHRVNADTGATETFDLSGVLEVDDHNNSSVLPLGDGRIAFFYGQHNDPLFRYRIWNGSGSFTASGSWTTEAARGTGQGSYSYPKPCIFPGDTTPGRVWLFYRRWLDGGSTRVMGMRNSATLTGSSDPWSANTDIFREDSRIPYVVTCQDGNRLHVAASSQHPVEAGFVTLHHFYGEMSGGSLVWKDSAGTALTLPVGDTTATRCDDGGDRKRWVSDIAVGADGHPRILWMRYPANNGTLIEYWHSGWTGSAWVAHKITDDGPGLYSPEVYYHGGLRFDRSDVTRVYLSAPISGVRQIQEWRTADNGATWAQVRVLTSGGTANNPLKLRPVGVHDGDGRIRVLWAQGRYTTFTDYSTAIWGAG